MLLSCLLKAFSEALDWLAEAWPNIARISGPNAGADEADEAAETTVDVPLGAAVVAVSFAAVSKEAICVCFRGIRLVVPWS